ncbi:MAG: hypothetical protein CMQ24_09335 [Gammaproteobacteria bacterium]|nr:hypothetical protein [Gammaproteobacteria bacterium]
MRFSTEGHQRQSRARGAVQAGRTLRPDQLERVVTKQSNPASDQPAKLVRTARAAALARHGKPNAKLEPSEVRACSARNSRGLALMRRASDRLGPSARSYFRVLKLARTIANLEASESVNASHIAEAIGYRRYDRGAGSG